MKKPKTTISDIAKYLNISASTVSRALNDHELINEKTKAEVKSAARLLNYRPNQHARSLQTGRSGIIGLLLPHLQSRFYQQIQQSVEQEVQEQGLELILAFSQNNFSKEQKCLDFFERLQIDGLIAIVAEDTDHYEHLELFQEHTPLVFISHRVPILNASMLLSNDRQGSYDATRYFIDQGYHRIAYMGTDRKLPNLKERERGFMDALEDVQLKVSPKWIYRGALSNQHGYLYARKLFDAKQFPDAVLCGSAEAATGWLAFCQEASIRIPSQLGLMTWDETNYCNFFSPSISTISQKGSEMGALASQILFKNIGQNLAEPILKLFRPRLTHRSSSLFSKDQELTSGNL